VVESRLLTRDGTTGTTALRALISSVNLNIQLCRLVLSGCLSAKPCLKLVCSINVE
jgi:hypothetical protein